MDHLVHSHATKVITGTAVAPGHPSRASLLAALRAAVVREEPYGLAGGVPEQVSVDRGKDFLSAAVTTALGAMGVPVRTQGTRQVPPRGLRQPPHRARRSCAAAAPARPPGNDKAPATAVARAP